MHASEVIQSALRPQSTPSSTSNPTSASPTKDKHAGLRKPRAASDNMTLARPIAKKRSPASPKISCLCAPTTHPGSFRCRFHRGIAKQGNVRAPLVPTSNVVPAAGVDDAASRLATSTCTFGNTRKGPPEKTPCRMLSVSRTTSMHKTVRSVQSRPSRLSRTIVAVPADSGVTVDEESMSAEDTHRLREAGSGAQGGAVDVTFRSS